MIRPGAQGFQPRAISVTSHTGKLEVDLLVAPGHSLYHASSALSGLALLANREAIVLRLRRSMALDARPRALIRLDARNSAGTRRKVTVDFADRADSFSIPTLEQSDVYFKRSFVTTDVLALPASHQERIIPFGLNFASLDPRAIATHLRIAVNLLSERLSTQGSKSLGFALREFGQRVRLAYGIPPAAAFECHACNTHSHAEGTVLLRTRLWSPEKEGDDLETVNEGRIALVQALQRGLGNRFAGGIIADSFSESICPGSALVRQATNMREYAREVKKAKIGVYVRGLHHSLGFKMAEYLAAGLCIVSEPLRHELPVPLEQGVNYLPFTSHQECLAQCSWLLSHPVEAARMQSANLDYYRRWVEPAAHMWDVLTRSFE